MNYTQRTWIRKSSGIIISLVCAAPASAAYTGLHVVGIPVIAGGAPRTMYRVHATFTDANDYVTAVYGSVLGSMMVIQSRNSSDSAPGSNFFGPVTSHGSAPTPLEVSGIPDAAYDTFFTIGLGAGQTGAGPNGEDQTVSQSMPANFIAGSGFSNQNSSWFTREPNEQGRAGWLGDSDPLLRVLIMQLTVDAGDNVRGTMNINGIHSSGLAGGQFFTLYGQTFNSIPAPGPIACLAIAAAWGRRRRGHMM